MFYPVELQEHSAKFRIVIQWIRESQFLLTTSEEFTFFPGQKQEMMRERSDFFLHIRTGLIFYFKAFSIRGELYGSSNKNREETANGIRSTFSSGTKRKQPTQCPTGSESHFKVVIVSAKFERKSLLQQHQLINQVLAEDLAGPVHALSIQAKTPTQWEHSGHAIRDTPECLGGKKRSS